MLIHNGRSSYMHCVFIVLLSLCCGGCALAKDATDGLSVKMQKSPEKLCSPEFYQHATPEEVKKEISGRSLATTRYTYRYESEIRQGRFPIATVLNGLYGDGEKRISERTVTPLDVAISNTQDPKVIRVLLDAGAKPEYGTLSYTLLYFLRSYPTQEAFDLLYTQPKDHFEALKEIIQHIVAYKGSYSKGLAGDVQFLNLYKTRFADIFSSIDLNAEQSALFFIAIRSDHAELVKWLVKNGAKLDVKLRNGHSPLKAAADWGSWESVQALLDIGADKSTLTDRELKDLETHNDLYHKR